MSTDDTTSPADGTPADDTGDGTQPDTPATDGKTGKPDPNPLLDELKRERRERKALESRLAEIERTAEEARQAALPEQERAIEQARRAARDEALAEVRVTLARAKVHAAAASLGFVDPADAAAHLALTELDPDKDSDVLAAVRELAELKPYLLGRGTGTPAPKVPGGPQSPDSGKPTFNEFLAGALRRG